VSRLALFTLCLACAWATVIVAGLIVVFCS
jgi:hypothetical protein